MGNFFMLLCRLITATINRNLWVSEDAPVENGHEAIASQPNVSGVTTAKDRKRFVSQIVNLFRPSYMMGFLHGRWSISQPPPEEYGINLPQHLSPVAVMQPVSIYNNSISTTQTNRMKQILRAAKGSILCFFILLMGVYIIFHELLH